MALAAILPWFVGANDDPPRLTGRLSRPSLISAGISAKVRCRFRFQTAQPAAQTRLEFLAQHSAGPAQLETGTHKGRFEKLRLTKLFRDN